MPDNPKRMPTREEYEREVADLARRFGPAWLPVTRLYPLLEVPNGVRTPHGLGTLKSVYGGEARVHPARILRGQRMGGTKTKPWVPTRVYPPDKITPVFRENSETSEGEDWAMIT